MIAKLWRRHQESRFPPDVAGTEIAGIDPVLLDTFAAGCIDTYVQRRKLDADRERILLQCQADMRRVIPELPPEAGAYFPRLLELTDRVLAACSASRPPG